jgi:PAS domain S-box-containing protein
MKIAMSLKTKMAVAVSALIAGVISVVGFVVISHFHEKFEENISRQQYTLIANTAKDIDDKLFAAQKALVAVAGIFPADAVADPERARRFLEDKVGIETLFDHGLFIFSGDGKLVAETDFPPGRSGLDLSYRDYYRKTVASGKPVISDPYYSTRPHHPLSVMFTAPLFDAEGKMVGLLGGGLELMKDNFLGKISRTRIGKNGYIYVFNTDRTMILHPDPERMMQRDVRKGVNKLFDEAIRGFEGSGKTVNSSGIPMFSSFKRLTATNWIVAGNYPLSEVHEPIYRAQWYVAIVLVMFCVLSMILARFLMKKLLAPLMAFTKHVADMPAKEGIERIFRSGARDEIGTLAETFNVMVGELDKRQEELRKFSLVVEQSPLSIVITDLEGTIEYVNPMFTRLTGYAREEAIGQNPRVLKSGETSATEYAELWLTITSGREWRGEFHNKRKNGELFWESAKISPITDAAGAITHFMGIKEDITARKEQDDKIRRLTEDLELKVAERTSQLLEAQKELVHKEKLAMLGLIAEGMGNELRNPLGVMNNAVYYLKNLMPGADATIREYLDIIKEEIDSSQGIISDLLDFNSIKTPQIMPVPVDEWINRCLERCIIPENVRLQVDMPEILPHVMIDPIQMERVLQSLITNAVQAVPEGGTVRVRARRVLSSEFGVLSSNLKAKASDPKPDSSITLTSEINFLGSNSELKTQDSKLDGDFVEISIIDTGEGIAPEHLEKLFQPLFTTKSRGIGLGLAISRKITETNGGSIQVESRPGEGATFTLIFPAADERMQP